ncbi:MAG TPA: hypothetical protein VLF60_04540 [Candidatus Saccharimonadales bacterium]|nr:hypothetical protein [Candidatus Saccharimonadales bacterium]
MPSDAVLKVKVMSPTQTHYDGTAVAVSAVNRVGPFDILANHANFFSLLSPGTIKINSGQRTIEVPITQGILKVTHNVVTLFVDIEPTTAPRS